MLNFSSQKIISVSELTLDIKKLLEAEYKFVRVSGEISNLKVPFSGHSYFTLKDSGAQLRAVLFKQQKRFVDLQLKDGQQVVCFGRITVYEPRGDYQLVVDTVEMLGVGQLQLIFEELKRSLAAKGYFEGTRKKAIPFFPVRIAVITSPTGAAVKDFLKIVELRNAPVHITILPVRVQGDEAKKEIAHALLLAQTEIKPDVIVLCRGGGSLEDLWAFNEEIVADAIFSCPIPVVTGIGHETDFTIADFCADHRCPTPTGAAEFLVPDAGELRKTIAEIKRLLSLHILRKIDSFGLQLKQLIRILGTLDATFVNREYRLQLSFSYFTQAMNGLLQQHENLVADQKHKLRQLQPLHTILLQQRRLEHCTSRLIQYIQSCLERNDNRLAMAASLLNSVSPLATIGRGYAVVRKYSADKKEYNVVSDSRQVSSGDSINVLLKNGELDCTVEKSRSDES